MNGLPHKRSHRWWIFALASSVITTIILSLIRFDVLGQLFTLTHAFRLFLLGAGLSLALGFAGWLGLRRLWLCGTGGIALGLLMMASSSGDRSGWEDLISLLNFFLATGLGIALGLSVELLLWLFRLWRSGGK